MNPRSVQGKGCLRSAARQGAGCLIIGILMFVLYLGFDTLEAPWASALLGRPTLTGHWSGTFASRTGTRFAIYLELERPLDSGGQSRLRGDRLSGRAYWCDDHGRSVENNPLDGWVPMFSGYTGNVKPVNVHIEPATNAPLGLYPVNLSGEWNVDTLTLTPELTTWTGSSFLSSSDDPDRTQPVTVTLRKAELAAYRSACAVLGH